LDALESGLTNGRLFKTMKKCAFLFFMVVGGVSVGFAADWPQFRGPNYDGTTAETIRTAWPDEGPQVLWKAELGPSFGSFAVSGGKAFAYVQRKVAGEDKEVAVALDADTGKELWAVPLGRPVFDKQGGFGPRSTPTVADGRVYILGSFQLLTCLEADTGKILWQHDLVKQYDGRVISWYSAASPIIADGLIFINAGGTGQALLAFNKDNGELVWKGEDDMPTHASPVVATIHGVKQVIFLTQTGLVSVVPQTGKVLWRFAFPFKTSTASTPIVWEDMVYCSAAYSVGAAVCRITKSGESFTATELWRQPGKLMNHWTSPVVKDGYIYGIFGQGKDGKAPLKCIEMKTGKEMWSRDGFGGGGATILVGNHILAQSDRGPLIVVRATHLGFLENTRAQIYGGQCWIMPVVSNGRIYARNTKEGFCLDVSP
jgi:outer membrane protein assembly factor BamB